MRIKVEESFWKDDLDNWSVSVADAWIQFVVASAKTRRVALRRAERTLEKALIRVRKMLAKEEAK